MKRLVACITLVNAVLLPVIAPIAVLAQSTSSSSINGWNDVSWGMTTGGVQALYPEATAYEQNGRSYLSQDNYQVGNHFYTLIFGFDNGTLGTVGLKWEGDSNADYVRIRNEVEEALEGRYGVANSEKYNGLPGVNTHRLFYTHEWFYPSTKVTLFSVKLDAEYILSVSYRRQAVGF